jgi:hypothetical protein
MKSILRKMQNFGTVGLIIAFLCKVIMYVCAESGLERYTLNCFKRFLLGSRLGSFSPPINMYDTFA